jgi:hypothetical protein
MLLVLVLMASSAAAQARKPNIFVIRGMMLATGTPAPTTEDRWATRCPISTASPGSG